MRVVVRAADFAVVIDVGRGPLAPLHGEARAEEQAVPARLGAVGGEGAAAAIGKVGLDGVAVLSVLVLPRRAKFRFQDDTAKMKFVRRFRFNRGAELTHLDPPDCSQNPAASESRNSRAITGFFALSS